jgi:hypothetical protein
VSGQRLIVYRHNEDTTEELQIVDADLRVKGYQTKGLQQPESM